MVTFPTSQIKSLGRMAETEYRYCSNWKSDSERNSGNNQSIVIVVQSLNQDNSYQMKSTMMSKLVVHQRVSYSFATMLARLLD